MLRRFWGDKAGAVAMIFGFSLFPLALAVGCAIDFSRLIQARSLAQAALDQASLAAALAPDTTQDTLTKVAGNILAASGSRDATRPVTLKGVTYRSGDNAVELSASGSVAASLLNLVGFSELTFSVSSTAIRPGNSTIEVALVLDNTYSMSDTDGSGTKKIDALKVAAADLVTALKKDDSKGQIKIGLVPYADSVNVGIGNRNQPWLSVAADTTETKTTPKTCTPSTTKTTTTCVKGAKATCTRYVDGVAETYDCTPQTCTSKTETVPQYDVCTGGTTTTTTTKWYGCVSSRKPGTLRLNDSEPSTSYFGFLGTSQKCLNPIVPLTTDQTVLKTNISGMIVNIGTGYRPSTYIPAGMVWGVNMLSPSLPLGEASAYDPKNRSPRKVLILMTDGVNTMRYDSSIAADKNNHVDVSTNILTAALQIKATNDDTLAICTYAKSQKMELYSIAFAVTDPVAKAMLQGCATDGSHYFDASDSAALKTAFATIAQSLSTIRIAR